MRLRITAPAKVNLHLAVGPLGSDGYHPVTTVLQTLGLADTVEIAPARGFSFECAPDLGLEPESNLAVRAARAVSLRFDRPLDVRISVDKVIPAGAGLGGASADAAAVLCGLCELWGLDPRAPEVAELARGLGADVPFFLEGGAALYTARGDILSRHLEPLAAAIVLVKPDEPVPTAAAYAAFDRLPAAGAPETGLLEAALAARDGGSVARALFNAMTTSSVDLVPAIGDSLALVRAQPGVLGCAMAGSGSAVFGICEDDASARACAESARTTGLWSAATVASPVGCTIEHL